VQPEGAVDDLLETGFRDVAPHPVETELLGLGAVELAVVGKEEVLGETDAEPLEDPLFERSSGSPSLGRPGPDETEQAVAPHPRRQTVGVDLDRVGRHVLADDDGGRALPHPSSSHMPEIGQIRLGLGPAHVQQMAGVVETVAVDARCCGRRRPVRPPFRGPGPRSPPPPTSRRPPDRSTRHR
jgi:hypothetical protein